MNQAEVRARADELRSRRVPFVEATVVRAGTERVAEAFGPGPPASLAPDTIAVVVASHGRDEAAVLTEAARRGVPYIGLVASARRGAAVLDALELSEDDRRRIRTPAGLDIGARTPAEVALAILAEIVSCRPRPPAPAPARARATAPAGEPVSGTLVDPVCGMTVHGEARHVDYEGVRYGFCGSGCQQAFLADPSGFLSR